MDNMEIVSVSEQTKNMEEPQLEPLTKEVLGQIKSKVMWGWTLHHLMGIGENDRPLPVHIHPKTLLAMVQEIERSRLY